MKHLKLFAGVLLAVLATFGQREARAADPVKIRIGWIAAPANLAPILFAKDGIAQHLGKSYTLDPLRFNGSSPMVLAIATGELDIALLAYSSFATAIENGQMHDLRAIADDFQGNAPGYYEDGYLVLNDSPIRSITDLKGKVLASNEVGGALDIAMRVALRRHNMEDKRDYTVVEAALPTMKAMLAERKVDLIPAVIPFAHDPDLKKISRKLFTQGEYVGRTQTLLWAARTGSCSGTAPPWSTSCRTCCALVGFISNLPIMTKWSRSCRNSPDSHRTSSPVGYSPNRTTIAIRMGFPICRRCSPTSIFKRKSAS